MLFMTSLSNYDSPVVKAMLANQQHFGRYYSDPRNMQNMDLWQAWCLDNGAIAMLNEQIKGKTFSSLWMEKAFQLTAQPHEAWFNTRAFFDCIEKVISYKATCKFVIVPDVPFSWEKTLDSYQRWHASVRNMGFPRAIAVQNGATPDNIPWNDIEAVFMGGDTSWKRGIATRTGDLFSGIPYVATEQGMVFAIEKEAHRRGKWVHWGRQANSQEQLCAAARWQADSVDGTGETYAPVKEFTGWIARVMWEINNPVKLKNKWSKQPDDLRVPVPAGDSGSQSVHPPVRSGGNSDKRLTIYRVRPDVARLPA